MGTCRSPVTFSVFVTISVCVLGGRRNISTAQLFFFLVWLKTPRPLGCCSYEVWVISTCCVSQVFSLSIVNIKIHISSKKKKKSEVLRFVLSLCVCVCLCACMRSHVHYSTPVCECVCFLYACTDERTVKSTLLDNIQHFFARVKCVLLPSWPSPLENQILKFTENK